MHTAKQRHEHMLHTIDLMNEISVKYSGRRLTYQERLAKQHLQNKLETLDEYVDRTSKSNN